MKRLFTLAAVAVLLSLTGCGAGRTAPAADVKGPVVLAASSLQEAMEDAAKAWRAQGHAAPVLSFAGSSALARQVEQGAPADLFVSADEEWMDAVQQAGLLRAGTRHDLLTNRLVVIGAQGTPPVSADRLGALLAKGRLALADPAAVPAGRYAKAALQHLGWLNGVAASVVPAENVRAALALVQRGEVPFGVVYATDARASGKVAVVYAFPAGSHPPILYPMAVL
jgi:molybdate transport system substrate-binding protein